MRFVLRLFGRFGFRWMVFAALGRYAARWFGRSQVDRATEHLEATARDRLPKPVANVVVALPIEAKRAGGTALVTGRAVKNTAVASKRAGRVAATGTRRATSGLGAVRGIAERVRQETDASATELKARYLFETQGQLAATDSLLDARPISADDGWDDPAEGDPRDTDLHDTDLHDAVPGAVATGRRRVRRRAPDVVARVRRSYRPAPKPWDR